MGVARDFCTKLTAFANFLAQGKSCLGITCTLQLYESLLKNLGVDLYSLFIWLLPWSQRLSFILYSFGKSILRRQPLFNFFSWHKALRAEKRKPLVEAVGNLTFMPSAFDHCFWLEDIFNCSTSHMIGWIKYLWGWEWSVNVYLYWYVWRTFALSTDFLTREG